MIDLLKNFSFYFLFSVNFCVYFFIIFIFSKYRPDFFGTCVSNEKTSLHHDILLRGLGVFFPFLILPIFFIYKDIFTILDLFLIFIMTFIGFWDDRRGLSQIFKLSLLICVSIIINCLGAIEESNSLNNLFDILLNTFYLVFLILFFNQIDGINGLAAMTFICSLILTCFLIQNFLFLVTLGPIFCYLLINLRGKTGIQGEAGSFFMGGIIFIMTKNNALFFDKILTILFLGPVLFDVIATTLIRLYYKQNIFLGHRNNFYQKLVSNIEKPSIVCSGFFLIQLILGIMLYELHLISSNYFIWYLIVVLTEIAIFIILSILIHKKIILTK